MQKEEIQEIVQLATAEAIRKSMESKEAIIQEELDARYHDVKLLLENYRKLKMHYTKVAGESLEVSSLCSLKHKTGLMMGHVDIMLKAYKNLCEAADTPDELRRWQAIYLRYITNKRITIDSIADKLCIDRRTFFRDVKRAMQELSVLLFGIEAIGTWNPRK